MAVPRIIHQLWKDADVPERYWAFVDGWRRLHPDWDYRLWTDAELERLVEARFPTWRDVYRSYTRPISRADIGRYMVLATHGGVYVDLDCECLKPIDPLIEGAGVVLGVEPPAHARAHGVDNVLCTAFMASTPGHPFWAAVLDEAWRSSGEGEVLKQTGPLMMNRAYRGFADKSAVRLLAPALVYPLSIDDVAYGQAHDIETWERATRGAYLAHYWEGSWMGEARSLEYGLPQKSPIKVSPGAQSAPARKQPFISCLMRSTGRLEDARGSIEDYLAQTHARRELVIAADSVEPALAAFAQGYPDLHVIEAPGPAPELAPLDRHLLAAATTQEVICFWPEGVRHDPRRLEVEQQIRARAGAHVAMMSRQMLWRPVAGRICEGPEGGLLTSVLGEAEALRLLARAGSDEASWRRTLGVGMRAVTFDMPRLMLAVDESEDGAAFEAAWADASVRFPEDRTAAVVRKLSDRLAIPPRLLAGTA